MRESVRSKIIRTASELFYKNGYNLTGINEVIAEAGIAKATLYNHFKSKEELCLAYLDARDDELLKRISAFCLDRPKGKKRLIAVLEFLIPFFSSKEFNGCWCIRTLAEIPKDNKRIKDRIRANKQHFMNFILQLVEENKPRLTARKQEVLAKRIYLLYEGAVTESHLQGDAWPIHTNINLLTSLL